MIPIHVLDEKALQNILNEKAVMASLRSAFQSLAKGQAFQPPQTLSIFPANKGDFITYLGVLAEANVFGAKLSPYLVQEKSSKVTAWTLLMSMETGEPLLLCDSYNLTTERTAATTALAVDLLAHREAKQLAVIGSGRVAQAHVRYATSLRSWSDIRVYSPNLAAKKNSLESLGATIASSAEEAVREADVVLLCTSSGTPVINTEWLSDDALVTSISTNVANAHEIPPESLSSFNVYCDYRPNTPGVAGEMKLAKEQHGWSEKSILADLPELLSKSHERLRGRAFFRSVGLGLEDVAVALAVLNRLKERA
jgi:L-arginine dehydrogenase